MTTYKTKAGDMLDEICHRFYGRSNGTTEIVLESNRDLAEHGEVFPAGVVIILPDVPEESAAPKLTRLWE